MEKLSSQRENYYKRLYATACCSSVVLYYKRCSEEKMRVEIGIVHEMIENGGYMYKILNGNPYFFTCAYKMPDKESGKELLIVHTPRHRYKIEL